AAALIAAETGPLIAGAPVKNCGKNGGQNEAAVKRDGIPKEALEVQIVRVGDGSIHDQRSGALASAERLGDDGDVVDAGLAEGVDDGGKDSEGDYFVAAKKDGVLRLLELRADFTAQVVEVDGFVAEVNELGFVDGDDETLLGNFADGLGLWDVDF